MNQKQEMVEAALEYLRDVNNRQELISALSQMRPEMRLALEEARPEFHCNAI